MATSQISDVIEHLRRTVPAPDGAGPTDAQLLTRFIDGRDEGAFAALVRRHSPMVWGVCRRALSHPDAEDAFQATFLVLVRMAAKVKPREMVANWLYGVACMTARRGKVAAAKARRREKQVVELPEPAVTEPDLGADLRPLLDRELSRLPDGYRAVVVLCDLEGKTRPEAARQLALPEGTIGSRLARGRAMLARRLARHGLPVSAGALAGLVSQEASAAAPASVLSSTIRAATAVAARQAAAEVVSGAAAALTEEVIKAMFVNKLLKASALLLAVVALVGSAGQIFQARAAEPAKPQQASERPQDPKAPEAQPDKPLNGDMAGLQGTWRMVRSETDGLTIGEGRPEVKDTFLIFKQSTVTMTGKAISDPVLKEEPKDVKLVGTFTLDTRKDARGIVLDWGTNPLLTKEYFTQRGIYALDGDSLKLCFFLPGKDTKDRIPAEFSARAGSQRTMTTWKRDPPSGRSGERKPATGAAEEKGMPSKEARQQEGKGPGRAVETADKLQGSWQMVTYEADGLTVGEGRPELRGNRLVIGQRSVTLFYAPKFMRPASGAQQADAAYTLDTNPAPPVMVLTWKECPWDEKKDVVSKAIYAVEGDRLTLCLSFEEGNQKAPAEFTAGTGSGRMLWTFKRIPPDEKGGAKKGAQPGRASATRDDQPAETPADYLAAFRELQAEMQKLDDSVTQQQTAAKSQEEREAAMVSAMRTLKEKGESLSDKALALVRPHAADREAVQVLTWVLGQQPASAAAGTAADLLARHHLHDPQTLEAAIRFQFMPVSWTEPLLRKLADADLPRDGKVRALVSLADCAKTRLELHGMLKEAGPAMLAALEDRMGKEYLAGVRAADPARVEAEAVGRFEELARTYGTEKYQAGTVKDYAESNLFELRHLAVGKQAPEIEGEDLDGKRFKLSDYRGKVVLLDFWGDW